MAGTESRIVTSKVSGRAYQISVALPRGYAESDRRYPVLYVLDANGLFGTLVEAARYLHDWDNSVPELIVVGLGYPVGYYFDAVGLRVRDLTPTRDGALKEGFARYAPHLPTPDGSGGAPAFLSFLRDELLPLIDREFRTDPSDRALYGHSLGGLFGFYALLAGEHMFQRFVIVSPALFWGNNYSFAQEARFAAARSDLPAKVFFALGEHEDDRTNLDIPMRMRSNFEDMVARLRSRGYPNLSLAARIFDDETHNSVVAVSATRGLRFIYSN